MKKALRILGIIMTVIMIATSLVTTTSASATTQSYTSWEGQFRMVTNENTHICGYKKGDNYRTIGIQTSYGSFPNFVREKAYAEVEFANGYFSNKIATNGFTVFYGEFQIFDEYIDEVQETVRTRYSQIFEIAAEDVEVNQETISFGTMKFVHEHGKTYCAHKFFAPDERKVHVGYLKFGQEMVVPVYLGDSDDAIYTRILGFDPNKNFDVYRAESNISGVKAYGYADFLISPNYSIEGMISPCEGVAALDVQEHPECTAPSNITEHGPIRAKAKSEVEVSEKIGFTNLYCEIFIFPEWLDAAMDYVYYIIEKYSIPEGPNQLVQAMITGATHLEEFRYEKHVEEETELYEREYGSHIFFTSETIRYHIGYVWFANGQTVNFYMGDFYKTGQLVFGFAAGFRQPVPTATPEPTATPKPPRPVNPTCPPCNTPQPTCPTCPTCPPTCPPCPTCPPTCPPCHPSLNIRIGIGICIEVDIRRTCR